MQRLLVRLELERQIPVLLEGCCPLEADRLDAVDQVLEGNLQQVIWNGGTAIEGVVQLGSLSQELAVRKVDPNLDIHPLRPHFTVDVDDF